VPYAGGILFPGSTGSFSLKLSVFAATQQTLAGLLKAGEKTREAWEQFPSLSWFDLD
jgi:hypothetical protein